MQWYWCRRKMDPFNSALTLDTSMHGQRKICIPCPGYKKCWRAWPELHTSPWWISISGFWQVCMAPESQQYTAFMVGNLGFYEFTRMPFGVCNAPVTFQRLVHNTLGKLNLTYSVIYLNDVIVFRHTEEHLEHLWVVFECFREFNLQLKPAKCSFFQTEIVYLAHHISSKGIHPSKENVCTIIEFLMLETYTKVRAFCGLVGHYCRLIKNFAHLVCALYDVLGDEVKMGPVIHTPEAQEAVQLLKEKILSMPVLVFPDFDKPFLLETDPSKEGLGVVLSQKQDDGCYHPVAFGSRTLTPSEQDYHSSKLEFLVLKWSVTEHFKEYLAYTPFTVCTDNNPLTCWQHQTWTWQDIAGLEHSHPMNSY